MTLGTQDVRVVEEVSGVAGVEAEMAMKSPPESMEGTDLSNIGHRISRRGECAGTTIVSDPSPYHPHIFILG